MNLWVSIVFQFFFNSKLFNLFHSFIHSFPSPKKTSICIKQTFIFICLMFSLHVFYNYFFHSFICFNHRLINHFVCPKLHALSLKHITVCCMMVCIFHSLLQYPFVFVSHHFLFCSLSFCCLFRILFLSKRVRNNLLSNLWMLSLIHSLIHGLGSSKVSWFRH